MNYLKQSLIEYQTKLDAVQLRLDDYYPEYPPKELVREWNRLCDIVMRLHNELLEYKD